MDHNYITYYETIKNKVSYCIFCELIKQDFVDSYSSARVIEYFISGNPKVFLVEPSCNEVIMENVLR